MHPGNKQPGLQLWGRCQGEVGKRLERWHREDLHGRGLILMGNQTLKESRKASGLVVQCLASHLSTFWEWVEGERGLLFSLSGLLLLFFMLFFAKVFVNYIYFIIVRFISLSGLCCSPTLSDSLPPRWGEELLEPSQIVCMSAGNLIKRDCLLLSFYYD